ncbi:sel1 repeat family protein [Janthinobacterium fluminis]|uniref:Sel1 repeat family protein n=1 Tax=Janthinobacterium fluminis TaxID=2987524 RepID=A0ABT5JV08_9BURK|nr:sel1 repeat family protein [Janthinobacterium fluminis]MDC8756572.1 sel1 repeat family protein [Janthinobacterium fluminis]
MSARGRAALALLLAALAVGPARADQAADLAQGKVYLRGGADGWPRALALFDGAARQGSSAAAYYLALMHKNGMGTARDSAAAVRYLEAAAAAQLPAAMFVLANMLYGGDGVARDDAAARAWVEKAAALEYPAAALLMAQGLRDGTMGFGRDPERAEQQLRMAAHALRHRPAEP